VKIHLSAIEKKIVVERKMIRGKAMERAKNLYFFMLELKFYHKV
jgi:hypothetical protein